MDDSFATCDPCMLCKLLSQLPFQALTHLTISEANLGWLRVLSIFGYLFGWTSALQVLISPAMKTFV